LSKSKAQSSARLLLANAAQRGAAQGARLEINEAGGEEEKGTNEIFQDWKKAILRTRAAREGGTLVPRLTTPKKGAVLFPLLSNGRFSLKTAPPRPSLATLPIGVPFFLLLPNIDETFLSPEQNQNSGCFIPTGLGESNG